MIVLFSDAIIITEYAENIFIIVILTNGRKGGKYFELKLRTMAKILVTARKEDSTQTATGYVTGERGG